MDIKELLTNPELLTKSLSEWDETQISEFNSYVDNTVRSKFLESLITHLINPEEDCKIVIKNLDLLKECQDAATNLEGDWNEQTAKLAVAMYVEREGEFEGNSEPVRPLTVKETYGLELEVSEGFSKLFSEQITTEIKGSENVIASGDLLFPVKTKAQILMSLEALEKMDIDNKSEVEKQLLEKAKAFGITKEGYTPLVMKISSEAGEVLVPLATVKTEEEVKSLKDMLPGIKEAFGLSTHASEKLDEYLTETASLVITDSKFTEEVFSVNKAPVVVEKSLQEVFSSIDNRNNKYLIALVGIARSKNLSQKDLQEAEKKYSVLSALALEKLLDKLPAEIEEGTTDPQGEQTVEVGTTPEITENSSKSSTSGEKKKTNLNKLKI